MKNLFNTLSEFQKGIFFILLSIFFMIIGYVFTRWTVNEYNPSLYDIAFWSSFGASIFPIPYILLKKKQQNTIKNTITTYQKALLLTLLISPIAAGLWFIMITIISADVISLFDQTSIVWSFVLGILFLRERIKFLQIFALCISAIGIFLISKADVNISFPIVIVLLLSPVLYAVQSLIIKKYAQGIHGFSMAWLRTVGMMMSFGIFFGLAGKLTFISWEVFLFLAIAQTSGMIINRMFYVEAHKYLPMFQLNFFYILVPVIIFFISPFIEQDFGFYPVKYFGAGLVIFGLLIFLWKKK